MFEDSGASNRKFYLLNDFPGANIICAVSSRHLSNMSLSYGDTSDSLTNRMRFLRKLDLEYRDLICAKQVHADAVKYVRDEDRGRGSLAYDDSLADTDAFITDRKNLPLAVFTADCLSVFLYDAKTPAAGIVHAGWRGTKEAISAKTVGLMEEKFKSNPCDLYASFGPCIRSCCYEVGKEFNGIFPSGVSERAGRYYLDLIAINKEQLINSGIREDNISDSRICTSCRNKDFFSYRKEGMSCGRIMSVMALK